MAKKPEPKEGSRSKTRLISLSFSPLCAAIISDLRLSAGAFGPMFTEDFKQRLRDSEFRNWAAELDADRLYELLGAAHGYALRAMRIIGIFREHASGDMDVGAIEAADRALCDLKRTGLSARHESLDEPPAVVGRPGEKCRPLFTEEFKRRLSSYKYGSWAVDMDESALFELLGAVGRYAALGLPIMKSLRRHASDAYDRTAFERACRALCDCQRIVDGAWRVSPEESLALGIVRLSAGSPAIARIFEFDSRLYRFVPMAQFSLIHDQPSGKACLGESGEVCSCHDVKDENEPHAVVLYSSDGRVMADYALGELVPENMLKELSASHRRGLSIRWCDREPHFRGSDVFISLVVSGNYVRLSKGVSYLESIH